MPSNVPMHGRGKPTPRDILRITVGRSQDWRFPKTADREAEDTPGKLICPTCHAISVEKRWFLDEALYQRLRSEPDVTAVVCAGCARVERGIFEGRVLIGGNWLREHKDEILNLVKNEEEKARQTNPFSRVGVTKEQGEEIELFLTTQWLAERIGKELHKAYKGQLRIDHLPGEKFSWVWWSRD